MFEERSIRIAAWAACSTLALFTVLPFVWIVATAFKTANEINLWPPTFLPHAPTMENFHQLLNETPFVRYIFNSLLIAVGSTASIMLTSSLGGFVFAKYRFPLFMMILASAIIPLEAYMVPLYIMVFKVHMLNTYAALIFPLMIMTFGVFF